MTKCNGKRFFVGVINFAFNKYGNLRGKNELFHETIFNGAVELDKRFPLQEEQGFEVYKPVFSLFYRLDNGKYLCLHNGNIYGNLKEDYLSNLESFSQILPQRGYQYPLEMSFNYARNLFDKALANKISCQDLGCYPIENFYLGRIELCTDRIVLFNEYPYHKSIKRTNLCESIPLVKYDRLKDYTKVLKEGIGNQHFRIYDSLFYLFSSGSLYNLTNGFYYNQDEQCDCERKIIMEKSLASSLEEKEIAYRDNISFSKALRLQKKVMRKG